MTPDPSVATTLTPSGKVSFFANGTLLGQATLASGVANFSTTTLPVGVDQSITATYVGDTNFATSTSTVFVGVTVSPATGTLAATIAPASAPYGSTATITATLTLSNAGTASGTITATVPGTGGGVYTGALVAGTGGAATATIVVNVPPPGAYTITVACPATTTNFTCTPTTVALTATKGTTMTAVSFLPAAPLAGQSTQVSAVISSAGGGTGAYTFTGTVDFFDNGAAIGTAAVVSNQATINVTFKANTLHNITATYLGDTNWTGSTSTATPVTALASPTTTTLGSNYTTALSGTNLILTAVVGGTNSTIQLNPTGSVTFYDNYNGVIQTLGTAVLSVDGPFSLAGHVHHHGIGRAGTHSIFSIYGGDSNFATSTSTTLAITEQDYSLLFNPSTLTLTRGQSAQVAVLLGTVAGFNGTITLRLHAASGYGDDLQLPAVDGGRRRVDDALHRDHGAECECAAGNRDLTACAGADPVHGDGAAVAPPGAQEAARSSHGRRSAAASAGRRAGEPGLLHGDCRRNDDGYGRDRRHRNVHRHAAGQPYLHRDDCRCFDWLQRNIYREPYHQLYGDDAVAN